MCGIFGWINPSKTVVDGSQFLDLFEITKNGLINTQDRGIDATGFYTPNIGVVKEAIPAKDFVAKIPSSIKDEDFFIGHCRQASAKFSDANKKDPRNAHPFESKNWVLVHNGTLSMKKIKGYNYTSDTDSESILAYTEKMSLKNAILNINGDSTIIAYDKKHKRMYFWTDGGRPLCIGYFQGIIFFGSTKSIIRKTLNVKYDYQIFPQISFATVYEHELLEYDFAKKKFTRKEQIVPEDDDVVDDFEKDFLNKVSTVATHKSVVSLSKPKELPRGCTQNPTSPPMSHKIVRVTAGGNTYTLKK